MNLQRATLGRTPLGRAVLGHAFGDTFRIDYDRAVRWRSQQGMEPSVAPYTPPGTADRLGTLGKAMAELGMDTSWIAPTIEAGGQVASSIITTVGESERQKKEAADAKKAKKKAKKAKKKVKATGKDNVASDAIKKKQKAQTDEDDGDDESSLPWGPILAGGAVLLLGGIFLLRKGSKPASAPAKPKETT